MPPKHPVFLAEDNPGDIDLLRAALDRSGVECDLSVCTDGASALAAIARAETLGAGRRPELFVLDLNLPKVDGLTILRRLRSSAVFRHTPVIMWTTSTASKDQIQSAEFGVNQHIHKPSNLREFIGLGGVIKQILDGEEPPPQYAPHR